MPETSVRALNTAFDGGEISPPVPPPASDAAVDNPKSWEAASHGFWFDYIDEEAAADFLNLTSRTLQGYRQRGGGGSLLLPLR